MGIYGRAAVLAKQLVMTSARSPEDAWEQAIAQATRSQSSREKPCPRNAFLGICGADLIDGVSGNRCRSHAGSKNGRYAIAAWKLLQVDPGLKNDKKTLWGRLEGVIVRENGQMDVVVSLWNDQKLGSEGMRHES
jgi:hypothetical protein